MSQVDEGEGEDYGKSDLAENFPMPGCDGKGFFEDAKEAKKLDFFLFFVHGVSPFFLDRKSVV